MRYKVIDGKDFDSKDRELIAIITDRDKLSVRSDEVDVEKNKQSIKNLALDLKRTIYDYKLTSLTAPQIGDNRRVLAINFNGDIRVFINPMIVRVSGFELSEETCSSIPNKTYLIPRHNRIAVTFQTTTGKIETKEYIGFAAKVMQHCIDHLEGILLSDFGLEIDDDYKNSSEEEKVEVINAYLDSLQEASTRLNEEIQNNEDLKQLNDAIDFLEKVQKGEVNLTFENVKVKDGEGENNNNTSEEGKSST